MNYFEELTNTRHKKSESMATDLSSMILQIRKQNIKESLFDIDSIGHRQQYIANIDDVMYYDDSKAESVNATWFTFENIIDPVVWIAGGKANHTDFSDLLPMVKKNVKALICLGKDNNKLIETFSDSVAEIFEAHSMDEAVNMANIIAQEGDIVLFSPACKSDKARENYIERGNQFTESVNKLENEHHQ